MSVKNSNYTEFNESSLSVHTLLLVTLAAALGMFAAAILLPGWLPNLVSSLEGVDPKGYWNLSRGSAFVAMGLLWVSMALGVTITNKLARLWPGGPVAFAIHEFTSLLGLVFAGVHGLLLLGDHYIHYDLVQILVPFASRKYDPLWVGIGQLGFYLWGFIALTFYIRRKLGQKTWRFVHYTGYVTYLMALLHGLISGSDTSAVWAQWFYWLSAGSLLFLLIYRIITSLGIKSEAESMILVPASD